MLRSWRVSSLHNHPCEETLQHFPRSDFRAGGCIWLVRQAGWEQPTPAISPALSSLPTLSNPRKAAAGSRGGRLLVNSQSKNGRRVFASATGEIIQPSPNGLWFFNCFLTHLLALEEQAGDGVRHWQGGGVGDAALALGLAAKARSIPLLGTLLKPG